MATTNSSSSSSSSSTGSDDLRSVMVDLARTQLAAMSAAVVFWRGWIDSAETLTKALSDQLSKVNEGGQDSKAFVGEFNDSTREFLRNLADLPNVATQRFSSELEKIKKPAADRARSAKAKP